MMRSLSDSTPKLNVSLQRQHCSNHVRSIKQDVYSAAFRHVHGGRHRG